MLFRSGSLEHGQALSGLRGEPLLDEMKVLKAWVEERATYQDYSDWLFVSQKGGRMDRSAFFRLFQQIAKHAELPADCCNVRVLKHSLGSHMAEEGHDIPVIAQALGHSALSSSYFYVGVTDSQADEARRKTIANKF